jgi:hypothetical protein|eukprot:COSAG06_NODE_832_length_12037_cov_81.245854_4_plen_50_part_00
MFMNGAVGPKLIGTIGAPLTNVIGSILSAVGILYPIVGTIERKTRKSRK